MGLPSITQILRGRGDSEAGNVQTLGEESLKNGRRWTFREVFGLSGDGSEEVVVQNNFDADTLRVVAITVDPDDQISGSVEANATIDASGTALSAQNGRINGDVADVPAGIIAEYGGTYSGGVAPLPLRNSGGVGGGAARTDLNAIPTSVSQIDPGGSLHWTITDESGSAQSVTFTAVVSRR